MPCRTLAVALTAVFFLPSVAAAQEMPGKEMQATHCTTMATLPPALSGWSNKQTFPSTDQASGLERAVLTLGRAATVTLHPTRTIHYVIQPEKPGGSVAHGGLLSLNISHVGTYQISLNSSAWIDVVKDGHLVMSSAHKPGPACTGIRKTVQFPLQPGKYAIQISANADSTVKIMASRVF